MTYRNKSEIIENIIDNLSFLSEEELIAEEGGYKTLTDKFLDWPRKELLDFESFILGRKED